MPEFQHSYALVVGINNYTNGIPPLQTAQPDAEKLAAILQDDHHYQVTLITDDTDIKPTRENLLTLLENPFPQQQLTERDRLLFYFTGHGIAFDGDDGPAGFLVPQDGDLQSNDTLIPMRTLYQHLASFKCRHLLVILDSCFAGTFRWSSTRKLIPIPQIITKTHYDRFIKSPAWQAITSASHNQEAFDLIRDNRGTGKDSRHSPFAEALFEALAGGADIIPRDGGDGVITATELYLFLRESVELRSRELQTPGIWTLPKHERGEYIFLVPNKPKNLAPTPELNQDNNPYRGLEPFDEKHSRFFFGRQELIQELAQRLIKPDHRLTVVLGASGSGKSSLVKAGLIPRLRQEQDNQWHILELMRPGEYPCEILAKTIQVIVPNSRENLSNTLQQNPNALTDIITTWSEAYPQTKLLLVIDQFEELITLTRQTDTSTSQEEIKAWQPFLNLLAISLNTCPQFHLVVTLRSDFETRFLDSAFISYWAKARFPVRPMRSDELREAIERPASEMALYFEPPNLVDRLIDEVGQMPGALPLLSFTLSELYLKLYQKWQHQETSDRALTVDEEFDRQGGVAGSLTSRANQEYANLGNEKLQTTMRRVMLRMLTVEGWEVARRQVPDSELVYPDEAENERVKQVIKRLVNARLVVRGQGTEEAYVEPAHDYLVRGWDKLQDWIKEDREDLTLQQRLTPAANDWHEAIHKEENERAYGFLWDENLDLEKLLKFIRSDTDNWLNKRETDFIQASHEKKQAIEEALREQLRREKELRVNKELREKAARVLNLLPVQPLEGLMLAIQGMGENLDNLPERLLASVQLSINKAMKDAQISKMIDIDMPISSVAFSPDGQSIVIGIYDNFLEWGTVRLWDWEGNSIGQPFQGHEDVVYSVAFSPDGKSIVSGSEDQTIRLWDLEGNLIAEPFVGHEKSVHSVAFSPDGKSIVSGSSDGTLRLWRGHWSEWLKVCCERLRYHPVFKNPETEEQKQACQTCHDYVWHPEIGADKLYQKGKKRLEEENYEEALSILN
jgi:hypothetical protein